MWYQVALPEQDQEYSDSTDTWALGKKTDDWHIGRIIYFINHSEEIRNINIDNMCNNGCILPYSVIVDGNHRFMAAAWLNTQGRLNKIHCTYGGRQDIPDYLTKKSDIIPDD